MRDDPEDPERDVASRLEEMKSRESIPIIIINLPQSGPALQGCTLNVP